MFPNRSKIYKLESSAKHKDEGLKTITTPQPSRTPSTSRYRPRPPYDGSWADMLRFDLKPKFERGVVDTILEKLRKESDPSMGIIKKSDTRTMPRSLSS